MSNEMWTLFLFAFLAGANLFGGLALKAIDILQNVKKPNWIIALIAGIITLAGAIATGIRMCG